MMNAFCKVKLKNTCGVDKGTTSCVTIRCVNRQIHCTDLTIDLEYFIDFLIETRSNAVLWDETVTILDVLYAPEAMFHEPFICKI